LRWSSLSDDELLDLRFCDLGLPDNPRRLRTPGSQGLVRALSRLDRELAVRGIGFRPHYWFAEEWFSPDGVPGIAIPFYLAHPRLARLERRMMGEAEGGNARWLMRILRHEAGHAVDSAWRLRATPAWRRAFGSPSRRYPRSYVPMPRSQAFVLHLGHWYAQSHPIEDFAETFAVWLAPKSRWRTEYADWPVAAKLRYVDDTMAGLRDRTPRVTNRRVVDPIANSRLTLREHYRHRCQAGQTSAQRYDRALRSCFAPRTGDPREIPAGAFIQAARPEITRLLLRRERLHPYLIRNVVRLLILRTRELDLVWRSGVRQTKRDTLLILERALFDHLRRGRERYLL
jgi:plasmid stabilization system protein ParE